MIFTFYLMNKLPTKWGIFLNRTCYWLKSNAWTCEKSSKSVTNNTGGAVKCIKTIAQSDQSNRHCVHQECLDPKHLALDLPTMCKELVKTGQILSASQYPRSDLTSCHWEDIIIDISPRVAWECPEPPLGQQWHSSYSWKVCRYIYIQIFMSLSSWNIKRNCLNTKTDVLCYIPNTHLDSPQLRDSLWKTHSLAEN